MDVLEAVKREMIRRRLSHRTIKTYLFYIRKFLLFCKKEPKEFSGKDCREFLMRFMDRNLDWTSKLRDGEEVAGSSLNVALNALRFMMEEVLRKSMRLNIRYSKTPKRLAEFLTKEEVRRLIDSIENQKHKLIVSLMYGAGLRVSEAANLKAGDIDLETGIGWVRHGKGNKDRPFIIPSCLKNVIHDIMVAEKGYLFPGRNGSLSPRSVAEILKTARQKAKIAKKIHPHTLRHSFATHLLESGCDITVVQSLLGHNEARTTMQYLHAVKPRLLSAKSPLDSLGN